jgi:hypothetical protein
MTKIKREKLFIPGSKGSLTYLSPENALREFWREVWTVKREIAFGIEPHAPWPKIEYRSGEDLKAVSGGDRIVECPFCGGIAIYIEDYKALVGDFATHVYDCILCDRRLELTDSEEEKKRDPKMWNAGEKDA